MVSDPPGIGAFTRKVPFQESDRWKIRDKWNGDPRGSECEMVGKFGYSHGYLKIENT